LEESDKIWASIISLIVGAGALASIFINLSIAGPIIGLVAGSVVTYFVQNRTQRRSWKRDFIIKNIETIYGPLYNACLKIEQHLLQIDNIRSYSNIPTDEWEQIQNSYTYHMIDDEELRKEIENFYVIVQLFNELCHYSRKRSYEILTTRASEFYHLNVKNIHYSYLTETSGSSSANISDCILFKIHPKDANDSKIGRIVITIEHQVNNTIPRATFDSIEEIKKFDDLWKQMVDDVNQDMKLQQLESLKLQIHTKNSKIQQKLVKKISERHNL